MNLISLQVLLRSQEVLKVVWCVLLLPNQDLKVLLISVFLEQLSLYYLPLSQPLKVMLWFVVQLVLLTLLKPLLMLLLLIELKLVLKDILIFLLSTLELLKMLLLFLQLLTKSTVSLVVHPIQLLSPQLLFHSVLFQLVQLKNLFLKVLRLVLHLTLKVLPISVVPLISPLILLKDMFILNVLMLKLSMKLLLLQLSTLMVLQTTLTLSHILNLLLNQQKNQKNLSMLLQDQVLQVQILLLVLSPLMLLAQLLVLYGSKSHLLM